MQSITKKYLFISLLLVAAVTAIFIFLNSMTNWDETYNMNSNEPYGLDVISQLLEHRTGEGKFHVIRQISDSSVQKFSSAKKMNYVFIGDNYLADSADIEQLLNFVDSGNTAFLSANTFPDEITNLLTFETADSSGEEVEYYYNDVFRYQKDSIAKLNFPGPLKSKENLTLKYIFRGIIVPYQWQFIDSTVFDFNADDLFVLGSMNEKINFIRIEFGQGDLFIHCTPLAFTNYFIVAGHGREYAEKVFSVIGDGDIIWDEYNKLPKYSHQLGNAGSSSAGPLMFILSRESLRWSWYLALFFITLYAIFIGKRRQRIIPVVEPDKNTSLEYARTVGKLYYLERDHRAVCLHKMKHFQAFLRNRYFILTTQRNQEMIDRLSMVSGVNKELVSDIFNQFALMNVATELSDEELIRFHDSLTRFYKECI